MNNNNNTMPCKNCKMMRVDHNIKAYSDAFCDITLLPIQVQEIYYETFHEPADFASMITYQPMDTLQYLEWEYERKLRETTTN